MSSRPVRRKVYLALAGVALLSALAAYWLGAFDIMRTTRQWQMNEQAYTAAAQTAIQAKSPTAEEGRFRFCTVSETNRRLVDAPYLYHAQSSGNHLVYFVLNNEVTMGDGLMYSDTGNPPPSADGQITVLERLDENWFVVAMNHALLEGGGARAVDRAS